MNYNVQITRLGLSAVFDLKGRKEDLKKWISDPNLSFPDTPNTSVSQDGYELYWIGPEHWLLRTDLKREEALSALLKPAEAPVEISIVEVSDTLTFYDIEGPDAAVIMAIASPLDTHAAAFPKNGVSYTEAFGLKALVVRREDGFELAVERSFADMLGDYFDRVMS